MRTVLAHIPLAHGLDTRLDERVRAPQHLSSLTNGYFEPGKRGAVRKRHGFTSLATTVNDEVGTPANQGPPRALFSTGDELCIRGHRSLYTWHAAEEEWINRGPLSPMVGEQSTIWQDTRSVYSVDSFSLASGGNYYLGHVAVMRRQIGTDASVSAMFDTTLVFRATTTDGHVLIGETTLDGPEPDPELGESYPQFKACRAASCTGQILATVQAGFESPGTLNIYAYAVSSPTAAPTGVVTHTDLYEPHSVDTGRPTHDISPASGGRYVYAYIANEDNESPTNTIEVFLRSDAHAEVAHRTINDTAPYQSVGISYDSTTDKVYVVASSMGETTRQVELWCLNPLTLATVWGPIVLHTFADTAEALQCAVTGTLPSTVGFQRITATWAFRDLTAASRQNSEGATVASSVKSFMSRSTNTAGADLDTLLALYNTFPISKPWFEDDRAYAAIGAHPGVNGLQPFGGATVMDLSTGVGSTATPGNRRADVAATFNIGVNAMVSLSQLNSPTAVFATGDNLWSFTAQAVAFDSANASEPLRLSADLLTCDFRESPLAQSAVRGGAIIGGGALYWYAGVSTEEIGFISAPIIAGTGLSSSATSLGTLSPNTTYQYLGVWETYDEKGSLIRSIPGPPDSVTTGAGDDTIDVTFLANTLTSRFNQRRVGLVVYRAEADGVFERASGPLYAVEVEENEAFVPVFRDIGTVNDDAVYTNEGSELEAVTPNGASIVMVGSQRVWLGGFWKNDRVQWSKLYNPGSATENAVVPEFHDFFTYILPRGKKCTGLAELDDKQIIFTEDEIYVLAGRGPSDAGGPSDYSGLTTLTSDAGCVDPRSVISYPGGVFFQSKAGIYHLNRGLGLEFVGEAVKDQIASTGEVTSAVLVPELTQVRFTIRDSEGPSGILVFDYGISAWSKWQPRYWNVDAETQLDIVGACVHQGVYHVLASDGTVYFEDSSTWFDDGTIYVPLTVETSWLQSAGQNGWQRIRRIIGLCAREDHHDMTVRLFCDFETDPVRTVTFTEATIDSMAAPDVRQQVRVDPPTGRGKSTAFKLRFDDAESDGTTTGEGYSIAGITLELGVKRGSRKAGSQEQS